MDLKCYLGKDYPEITGTSSSPLGKWDCEKPFAGGNAYSTNAVFNNSKISKLSIGALATEYGFDIIPDTEAVRAAGYTPETLAQVSSWYGPTSDGEYFYYIAFYGSVFNAPLPSILVSRCIKTGKLNYAVSCGTLVRIAPALHGDMIYFGSAAPLDNGPKLFAHRKCDGSFKWQLDYYPPEQGQTNLRVSDLNIIVVDDLIVCGSSSIQNTDLNYGTRAGGFPYFTDQGWLFTVRDNGSSGTVVDSYPACSPLLRVGDVITKGGDPAYDAFMPDYDYTVIGTVAEGNPTSMYRFLPPLLPPSPAYPGSSPVGAIITFTATMPPIFVQPIWERVDGNIYEDSDRTTAYTIAQLLAKWSQEVAGRHMIWSFLNPAEQTIVQTQPGNGGLFFYKQLFSPHLITNDNDANALNYWGNSIWGSPPSSIDDKLYFSSGQSHAEPFFDRYIYARNPFSYNKIRDRLNDAINRYVAHTITLEELNIAKDVFLSHLKSSPPGYRRSPRGELNHPDAIFGLTIGNNAVDFSIRTIPEDVYTFFTQDPNFNIVGLDNNADADVSAGVQLFPKLDRICAVNKGGIASIIDLSPQPTYTIAQYTGPYGIVGGTNYQSTQSTSKNLYGVNVNLNQGAQLMVTRTGELINNSFIFSLNVEDGHVEWNTQLFNRSLGEPALVNGCILLSDLVGKLYGFDAFTGELIWFKDNTTGDYPSNGGIASPCVVGRFVIWTPNYMVPVIEPPAGTPGKFGVTMTIDKCIQIDRCGCNVYPKGDFINYGIVTGDIQKWRRGNTVKGKFVRGTIVIKYVLLVTRDHIEVVSGPVGTTFSNFYQFNTESYRMDINGVTRIFSRF